MIKDETMLGFRDLKLERQVLGTLVSYPNSFGRVAHMLSDKLFTIITHKLIFRAIVNLTAESKAIDIITVTHSLQNNEHAQKVVKNQGWKIAYDVSTLSNDVTHDKNLEIHIGILSDLQQSRQISVTLTEAFEMVNNKSPIEEILQFVQNDITKIETFYEDDFNELKEVKFMLKDLEKKSESDFVYSYIQQLDNLISGWEENDFVIIAGAPGMGKTALALQVFMNQIFQNVPAAFFSLEMSTKQLFRRMISMETRIPSIRIRNKQLNEYDWQAIHKFTSKILDKSRWVIDDKSKKLTDVVSRIRKLAVKDKVKVVIIDYLQLIICNTKTTGTREQEVSTITRTMKQLASELEIVIIGLSQVSRSIEMRENKRPRLSDLRESGAIEQDADMVLFTYREDYYILTENPKHVQDVELIAAKGRHTGTGMCKVKFVPSLTKYIEESESNQYEK